MIRRHLLFCIWSLLVAGALAQGPDPRWLPVRDGQGWTFTDPVYLYSLSFPDNFILEADPEAMRAMAEFSKGYLQNPSVQARRPRFTLTDSTRFRPDFVPSLNGVVLDMPDSLAGMTRERFFGQAKTQIEAGLKGAVVTCEAYVTLNGLEFYRVDYQFPLPPADALVQARCYAYYDPQAGVGYAFTVGSRGAKAQEDMEALEAPLRTIHIVPLSPPSRKSSGPAG